MKSKRDALVILSPGFPKNEADTNCIPALQVFVKALKEVCPGLNIIVLTFQYPFSGGRYRWHGNSVISIGGRNKGGLHRIVNWLKVWRTLTKLNKRYRLMGLLSFWLGECALVGSYFARHNKLVHFCWLVGQDVKPGNKYFRLLKPRGDSLIAMSDFLVNQFKKNYGIAPVHVVPFGIDTSQFGQSAAKRNIDILAAGSLISLKQYELFIETVCYLKGFFPGIKAVICGDGPEMGSLRRMAVLLKVEDNVTFTGELPHAKVLALMQQSKIFLHPSNYEGFSTVLSEALYAGAHVVSFCKPMHCEFRHHYVAVSTVDMKDKALKIMNTKKLEHQPVLLYPAQQIAKNVISLFV